MYMHPRNGKQNYQSRWSIPATQTLKMTHKVIRPWEMLKKKNRGQIANSVYLSISYVENSQAFSLL